MRDAPLDPIPHIPVLSSQFLVLHSSHLPNSQLPVPGPPHAAAAAGSHLHLRLHHVLWARVGLKLVQFSDQS